MLKKFIIILFLGWGMITNVNAQHEIDSLSLRYLEAIKKGDKAYEAQEYKVALQAYKKALAVKPDEAYPEYRIKDLENIIANGREEETIPTYKKKENIPKTPKRQPTYYTVEPGNTLYRIAVNHGVSVDQIKQWNHLSSNEIVVGKRLIVGYE